MLAWHIATNIFAASNQDPAHTSATELSCYCTYLVDCHPELLPGEDDKWCKNPFKTVKKYAELPGQSGCKNALEAAKKYVEGILCGKEESKLQEEEYRLYSETVNDEGEQIANKLVHGDKGWEVLEVFWSNMILYLATSENLDGHAGAISRGGELITLLWALLVHLGIVGRLDAAAALTGDP